MTQVVLGENEGIESALRRFKREVSKAGIFQDMRKKRHFETPLEKEKRKAISRHKQRRQQRSRFKRQILAEKVEASHLPDEVMR